MIYVNEKDASNVEILLKTYHHTQHPLPECTATSLCQRRTPEDTVVLFEYTRPTHPGYSNYNGHMIEDLERFQKGIFHQPLYS